MNMDTTNIDEYKEIVRDSSDNADKLSDISAEIKKTIKITELESERLPKFMRKYYLRGEAYRLSPVPFGLFFIFKFVSSYLSLLALKLRKAIGAPRDQININSILYTNNPIHNAISCLNPGGVVEVVPGIHTITATTGKINAVDRLTLSGSNSRNCIIKMDDGANLTALIDVDNKEFVTVKGLYIDNNIANQTSGDNVGVYVHNTCNNIKIEDCIFTGGGGGSASGRIGAAISISYTSNITISGIFCDAWTGNDMVTISQSERVVIKDSIFKDLQYAAISVSKLCTRVTISGCVFTGIGDASDSRGHAIIVNTDSNTDSDWPRHITISNNVCYRNFGDQIIVETGFLVTIVGNIVFGNFDADNFPGATASSAGNGDMGISCSAELSTISGNVCCFNGSSGISVFNNRNYSTGYNRVVVGNVCVNNGKNSTATQKNGIWLDDVQHVVVTGNLCKDNQATPSQNNGIYGSGTTKYCLVSNNICAGNISNQIFFATNADDNIIAFNYESSSMAFNVPRTTPFKTWSNTVGSNYCYFSANCGGVDPDDERGVFLGYNQTNGDGESILGFNTGGAGGYQRLAIVEFDGTTLTERFTVDSSKAIAKGEMKINGDLNHDGSNVGFYGIAPVARQLLATGTGKTVDDVITALQNLGLVKQS